jgi:exopolysaccharide biosynthesis polyprenyl glycosylphosphotransferase
VLTPNSQARTRLLQCCDGCLFAIALLSAYLLRANFTIFALPKIETFEEHLWLFPVIGLCGPIALFSQGFYRSAQITSRLNVVWTVVRGSVLTMVALILVLFLMRMQFARSVILLASVFGCILVYARYELFVRLIASPFNRPQWRQRVLWAGIGDENTKVRAALTFEERSQIESITEFDPRTDSIEQFAPILHDYAINVVILNLAGLDAAHVQPVLNACEKEGVAVVVRPGLLPRTPLGMTVDWFAGEPVIHYRAQAARPSHLFIKQALDYIGAVILLIVALPVMLVIALAVKVTSKGPVLFDQTRAGLNGRPFRLFKFRSMRVGADKEKATLAPFNEMTGPVFKLTRDPRVTPIGRFLRRHGLDELPQLLNVARGEMSLVGPRPLPVDEVKKFSDDAHRRRLSVRPGLTCLWQINGRNDISDFTQWVRLDLAYIDRWTLWLDFKILLATIPVVIFGRGGR